MQSPVWVFKKSADLAFTVPSEELFGGFLHYMQTSPYYRNPLIFLIAFSIGLIWAQPKFKKSIYLFFPMVFTEHVLLSFRVSEGWDEFYMNLKHSWVLQNFGDFSFNMYSRGEATVDFLPYFVAGILGKLGFPLQETVICINMLGGLLFLTVIYKIFIKFNFSVPAAMAICLMSVFFPGYSLVGATGFTSGLFSSLILWSFYLWIKDRRMAAAVVLAVLPLIRVEGILFNFIFWLGICLSNLRGLDSSQFKKRWEDLLFMGLVLAGPFLILSLWRQWYFGAFMPNPVTFKNTAFDPRYINMGFRQLWRGIVTYRFYIVPLVFAAAIYFKVKKSEKFSRQERTLFKFWILATIFISFYHVGGGDWFPVAWARYALPSFQFVWVILFLSLGVAIHYYNDLWEKRKAALVCGLIFLAMSVGGAYGKVVFQIIKPKANWNRVSELAALGQLLKWTSEPNAVIASPEVATIMYFAERDVLDLIGVANPDVAKSPLNPMNGHGDILHRKRDPKTIYIHKPQFIVYYNLPDKRETHFGAMTDDEMKHHIQSTFYNKVIHAISHYRTGSEEKLSAMGYRRVGLFVGSRFFSYLVSKDVFEFHAVKLAELGIHFKAQMTIEHPELPQSFKDRFPDPS